MMMNPLVRSFHNPAHLCLSSRHRAIAADHQSPLCLQPRKPPLPIGQTPRADEVGGGLTSSSATHTRRRVLTQGSSLVLLASCSAVSLPLIPPAEAEDLAPERDCSEPSDVTLTTRVYLDVSIDGRPAGRIVIGLDGTNAPAGTARFMELVSGKAGVSYRRKEFLRIMPNYVQNAGVRSYGVDSEMARRRKGGIGLVADELIAEWAHTKREEKRNGCGGLDSGRGGVVGIVVRDPYKPPPKLKVVARKGKLEIDEEQEREDPNGTEFVITTKSAPELGPSTLVVGKVLEGMEVVDAISRVPTVQDNNSSPYFRVAKLIGDKRAVVAERGFNRPYSKVVITNCGLLN